METLQQRPWFGNVRELRNALEHALLVCRGARIEPKDLPPEAPIPHPGTGTSTDWEANMSDHIRSWARTMLDSSDEKGDLYEEFLRMVEPPLFQVVLEACRGQYAVAARRLGMHRTTLRKRLERP